MLRPKRITIIGGSSTGKSTLARRLSKILECDHIELDALYHEPNWQQADVEVFRQRIRERITGERWVVDGNYGRWAHPLTLANSDLIIWLDYPFRVAFFRVLRRTLKRIFTQEELWNGNRESLRMALSKESIILWVIQTHRIRRKQFPVLLIGEYAHILHLHFRKPSELEGWVRQFEVESRSISPEA